MTFLASRSAFLPTLLLIHCSGQNLPRAKSTPSIHSDDFATSAGPANRTGLPSQSSEATWKTINALESGGRYDRLVHALKKAEKEFPAEKSVFRRRRAIVLAELGLVSEAEALMADQLRSHRTSHPASEGVRDEMKRFAEAIHRNRATASGTPSADAERLLEQAAEARLAGNLATSYRLFREAWNAHHPWAEASLGAGLAAQALGDSAGARRLLDRALTETERQFAPGAAISVSTVADFSSFGRNASVSPDGQLIAMHNADISIGVFEASTKRFLRGFAGVPALAFDSGSRKLAFEAHNNLMVVHPLTGRVIARFANVFPTKTSPVLGDSVRNSRGFELASHLGSPIAFSPRDDRIAIGGFAPGIAVPATGEVRALGPLRSQWVSALTWSWDGRWVGLGNENGQVEIWSAESGLLLRTDSSHQDVVEFLQFAPEGQEIASLGRGVDLYLRRNLWTGAILEHLTRKADDGVQATVLSADGKRIAAIGNSGLELLESPGWRAQVISRYPGWDGGRLSFSPTNDHRVVARCRWSGLCAFDLARAGVGAGSDWAPPLKELGSPFSRCQHASLDEAGESIWSYHEDGSSREWDLVGGGLKTWLKSVSFMGRASAAVVNPPISVNQNSFRSEFEQEHWVEETSDGGDSAAEAHWVSRRSGELDVTKEPRRHRSREQGNLPDRIADLKLNNRSQAQMLRVEISGGKRFLLGALEGTESAVILRDHPFKPEPAYEVLGRDAEEARHVLYCHSVNANHQRGWDQMAYPIELCEERFHGNGLLTEVLKEVRAAR